MECLLKEANRQLIDLLWGGGRGEVEEERERFMVILNCEGGFILFGLEIEEIPLYGIAQCTSFRSQGPASRSFGGGGGSGGERRYGHLLFKIMHFILINQLTWFALLFLYRYMHGDGGHFVLPWWPE